MEKNKNSFVPLSFETFVERSSKMHGDSYIYLKPNFEKRDEKNRILIGCKKHGFFPQNIFRHMDGSGCPACWEERKGKSLLSNTDEFIRRASAIHGDKYDYSKVEYKRSNEEVCIICPKHGEFWQTPNKHLGGKGCKECGKIARKIKSSLTKEEFIERAKKVHADKYLYDKVDLLNRDEKNRVVVTCPIHGDFPITLGNLFSGKGCPECGLKKRANSKRLKQDVVIERFKEKYGDKYDYSKVIYKKMHSNVIITCPTHGDFPCTPANHLKGKGCPKCKMSHAECNVEKLLIDNGIEYKYDVRRKTLPWLEELTLDFYLPKHNIAIECQGGQHFYSVDYFGGDEKLKYRISLDQKKRDLCTTNGIKILYYSEEKLDFPYEVFTNLDDLLRNIIG